MTAKETAIEIRNKFITPTKVLNENDWIVNLKESKTNAIICVSFIINANPHSNPLNTEVYSTMKYWEEVKEELEKL